MIFSAALQMVSEEKMPSLLSHNFFAKSSDFLLSAKALKY